MFMTLLEKKNIDRNVKLIIKRFNYSTSNKMLVRSLRRLVIKIIKTLVTRKQRPISLSEKKYNKAINEKTLEYSVNFILDILQKDNKSSYFISSTGDLSEGPFSLKPTVEVSDKKADKEKMETLMLVQQRIYNDIKQGKQPGIENAETMNDYTGDFPMPVNRDSGMVSNITFSSIEGYTYPPGGQIDKFTQNDKLALAEEADTASPVTDHELNTFIDSRNILKKKPDDSNESNVVTIDVLISKSKEGSYYASLTETINDVIYIEFTHSLKKPRKPIIINETNDYICIILENGTKREIDIVHKSYTFDSIFSLINSSFESVGDDIRLSLTKGDYIKIVSNNVFHIHETSTFMDFLGFSNCNNKVSYKTTRPVEVLSSVNVFINNSDPICVDIDNKETINKTFNAESLKDIRIMFTDKDRETVTFEGKKGSISMRFFSKN